jgi:hypothetical protein
MSDLTADNSAIVMIDHAVGVGNLFRSHELGVHVNNTVAVAEMALTYGIPLVLTNGPDDAPRRASFPAVEGGRRGL